jgi:two-component system, LuxR family, sensor histidine kinase DctS
MHPVDQPMSNTANADASSGIKLPGRPRWFGVLLVLCTALLLAVASQWVAERETRSQVDALRSSLDVYALGLRSVATRHSDLPYAVAQHPDVMALLGTGSAAVVTPQVNQYLESLNRHAGADALYVMNLKGITVAASNWNTASSFMGQNYATRPYFQNALEGRRQLFYGIGLTTAIPGLFIAEPVRHAGQIVGVVAVKVSLREIEKAWANLPTPVMLADSRGIFFLGAIDEWKYQSRQPLAAKDIEWVVKHKQYASRDSFPVINWKTQQVAGQANYTIESTVEKQAHRYLALDEALPELGWTLTIMTDYAPVMTARWLTWIFGSLAAGVLYLAWLNWRLREQRLIEHRHARQLLETRVKARTSELQDAHAFQKAMENSLLVGMRARDEEGRIIYVNAALCDMTGFSANQLIGQLPPYPYWHPEELDKHWHDNSTAMAGHAALTGFESRIRHRDGHDVYTMVYTAPLVDASGKQKGWMSSVVDVSEQKRAEVRLRLHDEQLQRSGRLASLGEMASTLAHELNQPLMAMSNFSSAAKAFALQGNQALLINSLDDITAQGQRCADIMRRIRGFVRPRTSGTEACNLNAVVRSVLALLKPELRHQQTRAIFRPHDHLPDVHGDQVLLEQVVLNLVMNSYQAMQDLPPSQKVINIETYRSATAVGVRVADTGSGVNAEIASQLFDPFFTTKPQGLGLGLNICKTIVESHRGQLYFENRLEGGTVFTLQLEVAT